MQKLIDEINTELDVFNFIISDEGMSVIYLIAETCISELQKQIDMIECNEPIRLLEENKEKQKNMFIAQLTNDNPNVDKVLARYFI